MPTTNSTTDSVNITEDEVYTALLSLDSSKATSIDGISPAVLKNCAIVLTKPLHYLFSYVIYHCVFLPNDRYIASPLFSKLATKIVLLIIDLYPYSALCPRYSNILFMKKLQILLLVISLPHYLDSCKDAQLCNNFLSSSKIFMNTKPKQM